VSRHTRALGRELRSVPGNTRRVSPALALGLVWRHLPECLLAALLAGAWRGAAGLAGRRVAVLAAAALLAAVVTWPRSRRWLGALAGYLLTQVRLRGSLAELRLCGRRGRLPAVLGLLPTATGERVWLLCPVGLTAADLAEEADRLAAACFARRVLVGQHPRLACLAVLEVVRRSGPGMRPPAAGSEPAAQPWSAAEPRLVAGPEPGAQPWSAAQPEPAAGRLQVAGPAQVAGRGV
jgi:hypothetical protein